MIAVDSSVWIDFLNGNDTREVAHLSSLLGAEPLLVGDIVLLEVLQGIGSEADARRVEEAQDAFLLIPLETELPESGEPGGAESGDARPGTQRTVHERKQGQPDQQRQHRHPQILLGDDQANRNRDDESRDEKIP